MAAFGLSRSLLVLLTCALALVRHRSPVTVWNQWDTTWYVGIASHGYHWTFDGKSTLGFFPLYPLLIHLGMGLRIPGIAAGFLVANLAFFGALFYLYRFVALEWSAVAARRGVWLLALFPTAFFTFAPYTEALFLLCATGALYHARRRQALWVGLWIAAAVLTRPTGVILIPAALLALRPLTVRSFWAVLAPTVGGAVAYAQYLAGQHFLMTDLLHAQRYWHRSLTFPWTGFVASIQWLARYSTAHIPFAVENIIQLSVTVLFLAFTVLAWRNLSPSSAAYCAAFWILVLTPPQWLDNFYAPFSSMDRFVLALVPLAGWTAARLHSTRFIQIITASTVLMLGSAAVHMAGGWVG